MRRALAISLALHGALVVSGLIYFPMAVEEFSSGNIVPVDLVTLSDTTNVQARAPDPVEETPPPAEETPVEDTIEPAPAEAEPEPAPAEAEPEAVVPDPTAAETEPEPAPADQAPEPEPEVEAPPQPRERPEPQQTQRPQPQQDALDLDALSSLVDRSRTPSSNRTATQQGEAQRAIGSGAADTATLSDFIRSQANRCWRNSRDAPNPERLIVTVSVRLNRDGSLSSPPVATNSGQIRASGDPYWQVAQERALAAIIDCAPYRLPAEQYAQWRLIDVTFRNDSF